MRGKPLFHPLSAFLDISSFVAPPLDECRSEEVELLWKIGLLRRPPIAPLIIRILFPSTGLPTLRFWHV